MELTKEQCNEFRNNPNVNPLTGRPIKTGKKTQQMLAKSCNHIPEVKSPPALKHHPSPPKRLPHHDVTPHTRLTAPPMGPMIHWGLNTRHDGDENNNILKFLNYIHKRLKVLKTATTISRMEIEEFAEILGIAKKAFKGEDKYLEGIKDLAKSCAKLMKKGKLINDLPEPTSVGGLTVKQSRVFMRGEVLFTYGLYHTALRGIKFSLRTNTVHSNISEGELSSIRYKKLYLDYLVQNNIFTHEDIYEKTFPGENFVRDLEVEFEKYKTLYKRLKGKSP